MFLSTVLVPGSQGDAEHPEVRKQGQEDPEQAGGQRGPEGSDGAEASGRDPGAQRAAGTAETPAKSHQLCPHWGPGAHASHVSTCM